MLKLKIKPPSQVPVFPTFNHFEKNQQPMQRPTQFLYFHFGPGFGSHGSQKLLQPMLQKTSLDIRFWNEPSRYRNNGTAFRSEKAFANWLDSAEHFLSLNVDGTSKIVLVAHSFSALPILYLAKQHHKLISGLVFVSPLFNPFEAHKLLLEKAVVELKEKQRFDLIEQIKNLALHPGYTEEEKIQHAIAFLQEQNWLTHLLWKNPLARENWLAANSAQGQTFDSQAWHSVWSDFNKMNIGQRLKGQFQMPILMVMGEKDPMLSNQFHFSWHSFLDLQTKTIPDVGHFPHLEQTYLFTQLLQEFSLKLHR